MNVSSYFKAKINTSEFTENINSLIDELSGKRVIVYGAGASFFKLNSKYNLLKKLNVIAIADLKFKEKNPCTLFGFRTISPNNIQEEDYDYILVTNEEPLYVVFYLKNKLHISQERILQIFKENTYYERTMFYFYKICKSHIKIPKFIRKIQDRNLIKKDDYKYTIDDIEVFLTTHNRADLISESLESLLNQTAGVKQITVLDNESTDNTEEVVRNYESRGVKYIRTYGFLGNFKKVKEIMSKKYCLIFHDDDILNSRYLETVLKALNKYDNVSLITSRYLCFSDFSALFSEYDSVKHFLEKSVGYDESIFFEKHSIFSKTEYLAKSIFFRECVAYAPAIYRTEYLRKYTLEFDNYNKICDWPLLLNMSQHGNTILFENFSMFFVRRHAGEDSFKFVNVPSLQHIMNYFTKFRDTLNIKKQPLLLQYFFNIKVWLNLNSFVSSFLPPETLAKISKSDLYSMAKSNGLNPDKNAKKYSSNYWFILKKFLFFLDLRCMRETFDINE